MVFKKIVLIATYFISTISLAKVPQFSDYPVTDIYVGKNKPVVISKDLDEWYYAQTWKFDHVMEANKGFPNFAGRYVLTLQGCGSPCQTFILYDAKTGLMSDRHITDPLCFSDKYDGFKVEYRLDSRLLVLFKADPEHFYDECNTHYYILDKQGKFKEIYVKKWNEK